ncbi:MAG TPA: dephospho-CoA kinase [Flavobacteriales bacterium]|nr:dephospho-CoA kinase [Flavobacteriales bacterium]
MLQVGLTGGIGSGKTTVARVFRTLGIPVFEADAAGRTLLAENREVKTAVVARFGQDVLRDGHIDRAALARIVFTDQQALKDLNAIIHPAVRVAFKQWSGTQVAPYVLMEAAILAESGGAKHMDRIIVVTAPEDLRIHRVMQRDGVEEETVRTRLANQISEAERLKTADHVIMNDDMRLVIPQVLAVHTAIQRSA